MLNTTPLWPLLLQNYQYCWCVDPLDGTKEFLKRNGQFTVNIALLQGAKPVLGVVHVPVQVPRGCKSVECVSRERRWALT